jgi:hypothetical protein
MLKVIHGFESIDGKSQIEQIATVGNGRVQVGRKLPDSRRGCPLEGIRSNQSINTDLPDQRIQRSRKHNRTTKAVQMGSDEKALEQEQQRN